MSKSPSNFCHLHGEMAFSFNGHFVKKEKDDGDRTGVVLTKNGKVFVRDNINSHWEPIKTPAVFLFYDNKHGVSYKVDTCEKSIERIEPHGRIIDCTDLVIYEIKDRQWFPIFNMADSRSVETLVFSETVSACATGVNFQVVGTNPSVLTFSQIPASAVDFATGSIDPAAVLPGSSMVLLYTSFVCGKCTIIAQIIIRGETQVRVSAQCADEISPTGVTLAAIIPCPSPVDILTVQPTASNAFLVSAWGTNYSVPAGQMSPTGWRVPQAGDYDLNVVVTYLTSEPVDNNSEADNFILTQTSGSTVTIIGRVSVLYNFNGTDFTLAPRGQAVFSKGLRAQAGDVIQLYLVSKQAAAYTLDPLGMSLHAEFAGCF